MKALPTSFQAAPLVKVMINIGAGLDIQTGEYVKGVHGEHILNGGLAMITGVVGIGNNFKSTFADYMLYKAFSRFIRHTRGDQYDTEINIHEGHKRNFKVYKEDLGGVDIIGEGRWVITDKTMYTGDEYFDKKKEFLQEKRKNSKDYECTTPFPDRDGKSLLKIILPTFSSVDSFSEFVTADVLTMADENSLGDSGANTMFMRQGLQKNRFLAEMPALAGGAYEYMVLTGHMGQEFSMDPRNPPPKKLQHLKAGQKLKGLPEKFTFATHNCWWCHSATPLINQGTKGPEYPRSPDDDLVGDTDLNVVSVKNLRGKSGPSGMTTQVVVSQQEGVLEHLTDFHYIKENGRYGLDGNVQNYNLVLCPDIKLSRTTVRSKIDKHPELRRALEITMELCQINDLWHALQPELYTNPKQLYEDLIKIGYDWKILLATRGWWTVKEEEEGLPPFLSTMDLMLMRLGRYVPYWYPKDLADKLKLPEKK